MYKKSLEVLENMYDKAMANNNYEVANYAYEEIQRLQDLIYGIPSKEEIERYEQY